MTSNHLHLLFMTSRSGSSMVADIFVRHGFAWASDPRRNPLVGGKRVRYNSFENQAIKDVLRAMFGTPLGEFVAFGDVDQSRFEAAVLAEYFAADTMKSPFVWKGAVEFWPLWQTVLGLFDSWSASMVYRRPAAVVDSLLAKRGAIGAGVEPQARAKAERITRARYDLMHGLISDGMAPILTDELIKANLTSIVQAWPEADGVPEFRPEIASAVINPQKWEADR